MKGWSGSGSSRGGRPGRAVETGMRQQATTGDYLAMIAGTKPTLTEDMITQFAEDTASYART